MRDHRGWHRESHRHSLASRGIKTKISLRNISNARYRSMYRGIAPLADYDKDGVRNIKDCYPFDKTRHITTIGKIISKDYPHKQLPKEVYKIPPLVIHTPRSTKIWWRGVPGEFPPKEVKNEDLDKWIDRGSAKTEFLSNKEIPTLRKAKYYAGLVGPYSVRDRKISLPTFGHREDMPLILTKMAGESAKEYEDTKFINEKKSERALKEIFKE